MSQKRKNILEDCIKQLDRTEIGSPEDEARSIIAHVLSEGSSVASSFSEDEITQDQKNNIESILQRRINGEPLALIFGHIVFYGLKIFTMHGVSCPVSEMEQVVSQALQLYEQDLNQPIRILDLGSGTGCLLLALLHKMPRATGVGVDISEQAVQLSRKNAAKNGMEGRADFRLGDWGSDLTEKFDLIISNPPAAPVKGLHRLPPELRFYEPIAAVEGGKDGLDFFRMAAQNFERLAKAGAKGVFHVHYLRREGSFFRRRGFPVETKTNYYQRACGLCLEPCCIVVTNNKKGLSAVFARFWGNSSLSILWDLTRLAKTKAPWLDLLAIKICPSFLQKERAIN